MVRSEFNPVELTRTWIEESEHGAASTTDNVRIDQQAEKLTQIRENVAQPVSGQTQTWVMWPKKPQNLHKPGKSDPAGLRTYHVRAIVTQPVSAFSQARGIVAQQNSELAQVREIVAKQTAELDKTREMLAK